MKLKLALIAMAVFFSFADIQNLKADEAQVAVAANFTAPMKEIAEKFKQDTGYDLVLSFGATGGLYAQIKNGAPYEAFLAADSATPQKLAEEGLALPDSRFTYAKGRLALWSAKDDFIKDPEKMLAEGKFEHLAIANPKTAPYGQAAKEVLTNLKVWEQLGPKLVEGETIGQAHQFVTSGNAELGFLALAQVFKDGKITTGSAWLPDQKLYNPILQDFVILKKGEKNKAALALSEYLKSEAALNIIKAYGYE